MIYPLLTWPDVKVLQQALAAAKMNFATAEVNFKQISEIMLLQQKSINDLEDQVRELRAQLAKRGKKKS